MNTYLCKFTKISVQDKLELFDKLRLPIMNYCSEVWGFHVINAIQRVHLHFCNDILGVKKTTQHDFVYGELGRMPLQIWDYTASLNSRVNYFTQMKINILGRFIKHYIQIL